MKKVKNYLVGLSLLASFFLLFQNCGPAKLDSSTPGSADLPSSTTAGTSAATPTPNATPTPVPIPIDRTGAIGTAFGNCLDVQSSSLNNGALIGQAACSGGANQVFHMALGNDAYVINTNVSGKCVDVDGAGVADGTTIDQWDCSGTANQDWQYKDNGNGTFNLIDTNSGKCLTAQSGSYSLVIFTCQSGNAGQIFHFQ